MVRELPMRQERRGMITKRARELPKEFYIPNNCEECGKSMGVEPASKFTWVTDGTTEGTKGFCGIRCAKKYEQRTATVMRDVRFTGDISCKKSQ